MRRLTFVALFLVSSFVLAPSLGYAQCPGSLELASLVPDGSPRTRTVAAGVGNGTTYVALLRQGRSYSLSITTHDLWITTSEATLTGSGPGGCTPGLTLTNTCAVQPEIVFDVGGIAQQGIRVSFTVPVAGDYVFLFTNTDAAAHSFTAVLSETTLYNPAWSTFGTFETFYSCVNTTNDSTLDAMLKLFDTTGAEVASFDFTNVPAGGTVSRNTGATSLNVANSLNGSARLTHNGPPGAFQCEAAIANFSVAPGVIQPVKFEPVRPHAN